MYVPVRMYVQYSVQGHRIDASGSVKVEASWPFPSPSSLAAQELQYR